jgi:long-chain acyl-CoA synthetase
MRKFAIAVAAIVFATGALAVEVAGVKPTTRLPWRTELVLIGAGVRTKVFIKIYVGSLYVPAPRPIFRGAGQGPRRIQMNIMRSLTPDQLADALADGLKENNTEAELAAVKCKPRRWWHDEGVRRGEGKGRRTLTSPTARRRSASTARPKGRFPARRSTAR